jgi:hypothetical protein
MITFSIHLLMFGNQIRDFFIYMYEKLRKILDV